jgi:hypothetical protein
MFVITSVHRRDGREDSRSCGVFIANTDANADANADADADADARTCPDSSAADTATDAAATATVVSVCTRNVRVRANVGAGTGA